MPDLIRWEGGLRVAPYVRALKQETVLVVALVDSRRARIFEYRDGELREVDDLLAGSALEDHASVNVSKRATGYSGVRGKTGTDAAQAAEKAESERLFKNLNAVLTERAGSEGFLVIGGVPEAIAATAHHLSPHLRGRTAEWPSASVEMSEAEVRDLASKAASTLHQSMQSAMLDEIVDLARSGGKGALGSRDVEQALEEARVDTLLLSRGFISSNLDYADRLVGVALDQGARIEELSLEGAERLDVEGRGIAARLRYLIRT
jgi:stalled ribosome rescue protein Dom34